MPAAFLYILTKEQLADPSRLIAAQHTRDERDRLWQRRARGPRPNPAGAGRIRVGVATRG